MEHESVTWRACLDRRPTIVHAAIGAPSVGTFDFLVRGCWCLYLFLPPWEGRSEVDGHPFPFAPRFAVLVPPGVRQRYEFTARSTHLYAHFRLSRSAETVAIRAARRLGDGFAAFNHDFEQVIGNARALPRRAEVKLWDMLWDLAMQSTTPTSASPDSARGPRESTVDRLIRRIELGLATPLSLNSLAQSEGLSATHLTRLFKSSTGKTVVRFIRDRRVAHAEYLLRTTSRPIKSIAHEVGIPDLHHFNKVVRAQLGRAPRDVRGK